MPISLTQQFEHLNQKETNSMTTQSSDDQQLRNIARDVRFLTYKAGAPHPLARWLFLSMLAPLLLIFAVGFLVELAIQFNVFTP